MQDLPLILPFQAPIDTIRDATEELRTITAQYDASHEVAQLRPAPSNGREASSDIAFLDTGEGAKGGRKRRKQRLQEVASTTDNDSGNGKKVSGSDVVRVMTAVGSGKRKVRPPLDHIEKLLEEDCPNHAYPFKHKLRNCGMMKNFMASESLIRGMELDKVPDEGNAMPFPREDAVMTIYDGRPSLRMCHVSNLSLVTLACCD
jgi:hypothetical protein